MKRPLVLAAAGGVASGLLLLLAAGRTWAGGDVVAATGGHLAVRVTGRGAVPALPAIGFALVVLTGATIGARGTVRRLVGVAGALVGAAAAWLAARADLGAAVAARVFGSAHPPTAGLSAWQVLAVAAGVLGAGAGAVVAVRGHRWPGLGARYDAPVAARAATVDRAAPDDAARAWAALDRGDDPTASGPG